MDNLNIDIENISIINEFIDIDINLINSLKSTFSNKQDLYDFVYAIFSLAGMGASYCKYSTEARNLKDTLYPGLVKGVMWYYTPKMYWIIISLLENDNNLIAYYFKGKAFNELLGQPSQYKIYKSKEFHPLNIKCAENSIYYYNLFLNNFKEDIDNNILYSIHIKQILENLTSKYLIIGQKTKAIEILKSQYDNYKNDDYTRSKSAQSIAILESNENTEKELEILYYYYKDMGENENIKQRIAYLEDWIKLKQTAYNLMKEGKRQIDIMAELNINKTIMRHIIEDFKKEGKVEKVNNKYVAI